MNEQIPNSMNPDDEKIAQKLNQVAEQTHANAQFAAELEEKLKNARPGKPGWFAAAFKQISPVLRWAVLMILLAAALSWSIKTLIPAPQPATDNTPVVLDTATPTPEAVIINQTATPFTIKNDGYDWRGTKLYLVTSLPESPDEANVYVIQPEQPATIESVRALADLFGMRGEIFEADLEPNASSAFSAVDGTQRLNVRSDRYFEYIPDTTLINSQNSFSLSNPNAEAIIDEFMKAHNFNFPYRIEPSELYQGFYAQALTPDGFPIHHEYFGQDGLLFHLNDTQIVFVSASLPKYDQVGTYGIKSAEEAFQQVLAATDFNGMIEGVHSSEKPPQVWKRSYPLNQTVTVYGFMNVNQSADGQELLVSIDSFLTKGNLTGAETLEKLTLVKATGQFTLENDNRVLNVESWEVYKQDDHGSSGKDAFLGTLQKQGEDVVIISEKGTFIMPDVPVEVPLPLENAYVYGLVLGDLFEWEGIEHREINEGGGGGGGSNGNGFYKLNLSGPSVRIPTPTPQPGTYQGTTEYVVQENDTLASIALNFGITVEELAQANDITGDIVYLGQKLFIPGQQTENPYVGRHLEKQRGRLVITIYRQPDGSSQNEFVFIMKNEDGTTFHAALENVSLEALRAYHNLPLDVWGTVERVDQNGTPVINVERYEVPFPDLQIRLLQGKQKLTEVEGQQVILFTATDGTTYAQMLMNGVPDAITALGIEGDEVILESLAIPGESFGGYPTLHVFAGSMATNPKNNQPAEMIVTANQPYVMEEAPGGEQFVLPSVTIEKVELIYYIPNSRYVTFAEGSDAEYIQPAWRFYGHYESGNEFEILIQALKQEYLLPELAPYTRPG